MRRNQIYDRARILDHASRARARKRDTRAVELYRWVLAVEPGNAELQAKLAPLLAGTSQAFDAWNAFRAAARASLRAGRPESAMAIYRDAATHLPREIQVWMALAALRKKRGQKREAADTLLEGSRGFRSRWLRPQAIHLLRAAHEIRPWDFETVIDLARLLSATRQRQEAGILLDGLAKRCGGDRLRRVRGAQLRRAPSLRGAWLWLMAAVRPAPEPPPPRRRESVVPLRAHRIPPR